MLNPNPVRTKESKATPIFTLLWCKGNRQRKVKRKKKIGCVLDSKLVGRWLNKESSSRGIMDSQVP
jgi:hypothetical protein